MATVRVYLLTYRRPHLLPRALAALRAQTFTDWVCELHNDAPDDPVPGRLAAETGDPRIRFFQHEKNLGPNRTFNLVFQPCRERYVCLLEDDNWWEPAFLETMVGLLDRNPGVQVAWSNMTVWRENADTGWTNTGRTLWPLTDFSGPAFFAWPHERHLDSLVHSNGSALIRNEHLADLIVPPETPFLAMEPIRERAMRFPLLFCPQPLVNFAWTLATARESSSLLAAEMKALLTAAYLRHAALDTAGFGRLVDRARRSPANELGGLLVAACLARHGPSVARHIRPAEWPRLAGSFMRHLRTNLRILRARRRHAAIWTYLDLHTARRFAEIAQPRA
jgi:glycosyltransferase involved in cell wall biosynthesis